MLTHGTKSHLQAKGIVTPAASRLDHQTLRAGLGVPHQDPSGVQGLLLPAEQGGKSGLGREPQAAPMAPAPPHLSHCWNKRPHLLESC